MAPNYVADSLTVNCTCTWFLCCGC